eukprot:SAG31_NODE_1982_length_6745_cov_8.400090_1_plen_152_part_00
MAPDCTIYGGQPALPSGLLRSAGSPSLSSAAQEIARTTICSQAAGERKEGGIWRARRPRALEVVANSETAPAFGGGRDSGAIHRGDGGGRGSRHWHFGRRRRRRRLMTEQSSEAAAMSRSGPPAGPLRTGHCALAHWHCCLRCILLAKFYM